MAVLVVFCKLEVLLQPEPVAGKEQLHVLKNELVDLQYKTVEGGERFQTTAPGFDFLLV